MREFAWTTESIGPTVRASALCPTVGGTFGRLRVNDLWPEAVLEFFQSTSKSCKESEGWQKVAD